MAVFQTELENNRLYGFGKWHCDDFIELPDTPDCVKDFINNKRASPLDRKQYKDIPLFATFDGVRVRVTMASRFGDVGITENLKADSGYSHRVYLCQLSNFSVIK